MSMRCGSLLIMLALVLGSGPACGAVDYGRPRRHRRLHEAKPDEPGKKAAKKTVKKHRHRRAAAAVPQPAPAPKAATTGKAKPAQAIAAKAVPAKPDEEEPRRRTADAQAGRHDHRFAAARAPMPASRPDEQRKIQSALLWAGDYAGVAKDEDPLRGAVKNFQKRHKAKITGVLTVRAARRACLPPATATSAASAGAW